MNFNIFKNKLIVIEGLDETGKTSVGHLLADDLKNAGIKVIETFQPGGDWGPLAPLVRSMCKDKRFELGSYANLFAFLLDRAECIEKIVKPALDSGKTVICDRWSYSTVAYQLYGKGMLDDFEYMLHSHDDARVIKEWITNSFFNISPDYTFYFSTKIGNRGNSQHDNFDNAGSVFEKRVKDAYDEMKVKYEWIEIEPGNSAQETLTNLYNKVEIRDELI
jgi:dTMP kinase